MPVYIYGLQCPLTDAIRYIGKSADPARRRNRHVGAAARGDYSHHTARWLRKILTLDLMPSLVILEEVAADARWQEAERHWIAYGKAAGWPLTNSTAGGEGLDYIDPAAEAVYKKNLSRAMKELWNRPERREEARQRSLKAWADPKLSAERIAKGAATHAQPAVKAKWSSAMAEVNARPEVKAAKSAAMKSAWQTDEYRAIITAARNDPTFLAEQSQRLVERWQDAEHREKMQNTRWTEEKRKVQAERVLDPERQAKIKAKMTPEVIARRNAAIKASWDRRKAARGEALWADII
jgi:hypothetical protein